MGKTFMKYTFGAVIVYLAVAYGTNFGNDISAGAQGYATAVRALQGQPPGGGAPARRRRRN